MKKLISLLLLALLNNAIAQNDITCTQWPTWSQAICSRLQQILQQGNKELYLSGYAWHNRYTYTQKKLRSYNEQAWGGGMGKGLYDEKGDWHGLFAFAFLDSHKNIEPVVGYGFLKIAHVNQNTRLGLGYTILVTARPDIMHNVPFPGLLPWASVNYRNLTLCASYIPGKKNNVGNVLYLVGKWVFPSL